MSDHKFSRMIFIGLFGLSLLCGCGGPSNRQDWTSEAPHFGGNRNGTKGTINNMPSPYAEHLKKGRLTIQLAQYTQSQWLNALDSIIARAKQVLETDDIWVMEEPMGVTVYYGHFQREMQARAEFVRVQRLFKQMKLGELQIPYLKEIPVPDPAAPAEWHIFNSNCMFTLEIGIYYNVPEKNYYQRKTDAIKAVKTLRDSGEKAFYVHGPQRSIVYVGCFGMTDLQINPKTLLITYQSPYFKSFQKKYPFHYEQGAKVNDIVTDRNGKRIKIPRKSVIVNVEKLWYEMPR